MMRCFTKERITLRIAALCPSGELADLIGELLEMVDDLEDLVSDLEADLANAEADAEADAEIETPAAVAAVAGDPGHLANLKN
jgi:hypothetical protein